MRASDRRGCADGSSRVTRRTQGRGAGPTKTGVLPVSQRRGAAGGNHTMNQRQRLVTEGEVGVVSVIPKRPLDNTTNGGRYPLYRLGEESAVTGTGARAAPPTCTSVPEEGREVSNERCRGRELDALLLKADHRGVYKRFLVWGWLVPVCLLIPCAHLSFMLMLYLPPSNCTLPHPPLHVSLDAWRKLATPRTSTGELNTCALYDFPSALKDSDYDPGQHHQYSSSISEDTHDTFQDPGTFTLQPDTSQDTGTPRTDTGIDVNDPGVSEMDDGTDGEFPSMARDPSKPQGDAGSHQDAPGTYGGASTPEKDTSNPRETQGTSEHKSPPQHTPVEGHSKSEGDTWSHQHTPGTSGYVSNSEKDTSSPMETQSTSKYESTPQHTPVEGHSTPNDGLELNQPDPTAPGPTGTSETHDPSEPEHPSNTNHTDQQLNTPAKHYNSQDDSQTPELYHSITDNPFNTPSQDHHPNTTTNTTYSDLSKSHAAHYFDPFDDLFELKKMNETKPVPKHDPLKEYRTAALLWQKLYPLEAPASNYTMGCVFGYDFDQTYVQETLSTRFGYACAESKGSTRILHASMAGNLVGCILFGALADKLGRKWVFMVLAMKVALLGTLFVLARGPWALLLLRFLVALGLPAIYQVVLITALEQVTDGERGLVTSLSSVCFSLGQCLLALLAWLTGHWVNLGLATSLPAILALLYLRLVEESPRWLVCKGRAVVAAKVFRRVTARNKDNTQPLPSLSLLRARIRKITSRARAEEEDELSEACHGACAWITGSVTFLMTYPYLSGRVFLYTICWTVNLVIYYVSTMKYPHVSDNPYVAWFCASATDVPANLLVPLLLRWLGRRTLHSSGFAVCSAAFFMGGVLLACGYKESFMGVVFLVLVAKFCSAMVFLVVYLQAAELHPTPIRSFVTGLASFVALTVNIFSPSILAMDNPTHSYILLGVLGIFGGAAAFLLPETAGHALPQTLMEAENITWRIKEKTSTANPSGNTPTTTASTTMMDAQRENDRRLPSSFEEIEEEEEEEEEDEEDEEEDETETEEEESVGVYRSVRSPPAPHSVPRCLRTENESIL